MLLEILPIAAAAFIVAGGIKGALGIGLPVTAIGLLTQFTDPRVAVALALIPIFVANGWQTLRMGGMLETLRQYWVFLICLSVVLLAMLTQLDAIPVHILEAVLGVVIILFALTNLMVTIPTLPDRYDRAAQVGVGITAGIFGGLSGLWAPPFFLYLISRRVEKDAFVRATGVMLLLGSFPLIFGYWRAGYFEADTALTSLVLVIPTLAGFYIGEKIRGRIDSARFRTVSLIAFLLIGLNLLRESIF